MSVRTAGIPKSTHFDPPVPELITLSEALPGWGSRYVAFGPHTPSLNCPRGWHLLQNLPKRWCSPQPLARWWRPAIVLSAGHVTTVEPPEVAALAVEPPEVSVVSSCELSPCPVTAGKAVCELSPSPVTAMEAVCELSPCPVTAMEAVL